MKKLSRGIQTILKLIVAALTMMVLLIPAFGQAIDEEWFNKGVALMNQNKYDEATQAFDKAIELNPQYVEAWAGKGWALCGRGRYNEAFQAYDKAIELNPNYADAWVGKGFTFLIAWSGSSMQARDAFSRAIALDPNYGLAWLGEWMAGIYYEKAIQLNPKYTTEILSDTSRTMSFQRMVFLKEGRPRTATKLSASPVLFPAPQKSVAERFAELNKNVTK